MILTQQGPNQTFVRHTWIRYFKKDLQNNILYNFQMILKSLNKSNSTYKSNTIFFTVVNHYTKTFVYLLTKAIKCA